MKCLCPSKKISINIDVFDDQNNADKAYETAKKIAHANRHVAIIGHHLVLVQFVQEVFIKRLVFLQFLQHQPISS
jgi:hypothetical protein